MTLDVCSLPGCRKSRRGLGSVDVAQWNFRWEEAENETDKTLAKVSNDRGSGNVWIRVIVAGDSSAS